MFDFQASNETLESWKTADPNESLIFQNCLDYFETSQMLKETTIKKNFSGSTSSSNFFNVIWDNNSETDDVSSITANSLNDAF